MSSTEEKEQQKETSNENESKTEQIAERYNKDLI